MTAIRTDALQIWPQAAYERDMLVNTALGRKRFLFNGPDAIHRVLVENTANYRRSPAAIRILRPIVGDGLVLSEGAAWRHQRRTIAPALAPRVLPILARHVAEAADETCVRLAESAGTPVDLLAVMQVLALEIAARSMFSLEIKDHGTALRALMARFADRLGRPYFLDTLLPPAIPTWQDFSRRRFRVKWTRVLDDIIAARLQATPAETPRDLFDMLRAARDPETGAAFTPPQLRDQVATMIVAGHETTALTLFWSLYLLANARAEQELLAAEASGIDLAPDVAAEAKLPYTRAVVNETLRLYPPVFAIVRMANAADRIGDLEIAAGSVVIVAPWVLHRHTKFWNNAEAFDPARFQAGDPPAHRFAYLPFGAGPRVCIGAQFALTEASLVLARLAQRFEFALAEDAPVLPLAIVTTQPNRPALFRLRAR